MKQTIILAIDQSYTSSGVMVFRGTEVVHMSKFVTDKTTTIFDRAWECANMVKQLIKDYNVDVVAMEGLAFGATGDATRNLAGLQFVIATQAKYVLGIDCEIYAPGTIKKLATGKGNSKKQLLVDALPDNIRLDIDALGVKKSTGLMDLTDAYWIGRTALANYDPSNNEQREEKKQ